MRSFLKSPTFKYDNFMKLKIEGFGDYTEGLKKAQSTS